MELLEKIKLKDGTELTLVPMGIDINEYKKEIAIRVLSDLSFSEMKDALLNEGNLSELQHLSSYGELLESYFNCVSISKVSEVMERYNDDYLYQYEIILSTDAILTSYKALKKEVELLKEQKIETELETDYRLSVIELGLN